MANTAWTRASGALPRMATPWRFPLALSSWGASGKPQIRAVQNSGRTWQEIYPILDTNNPNVRQLLSYINFGLRQGIFWDIQHPYLQRHTLGVGGGSPLVNGANQTGSALVVDGCPASVTNWLLPGDIFSVVGGSVVYDVMAPISTNSSGQATIGTLNPLLWKAPADNAVVTIDPTLIKVQAVIADVSDFPQMDVTRFIDAGLTITWREVPA